MPESPLVQKETVALSDLEALIAARAKGESETELGFRKRIDREEAEYRAGAKQLPRNTRSTTPPWRRTIRRARDQVVQTFQRDTQATKAEYEQTKKQIDEQLKKDSRRAKKTKEETGWQALAMFEGQRDEGIKWRRAHRCRAGTRKSASFITSRTRQNTFSSAAASWPMPLPDAAARPQAPADTGSRRVQSTATARTPQPRADAGEPAAPAAKAASRPKPPVEQTPLVDAARLAGHTSMEEHLVAPGRRSSFPSFSRIDTFIWPWLLLGAARRRRAGLWHGGRLDDSRDRGRRRGDRLGSRGLLRAELDGTPERGQARRAAAKVALTEAEQLVESEKDWIKNKFDGKIKELEKKRETMVRDAEELLARRVAEFQSRHQKQTEEADKTYPARLEQISVRRDEGLKKAEEHFPPRIAALKEKYEKDRKRARRVVPEDQRDHQAFTTTRRGAT